MKKTIVLQVATLVIFLLYGCVQPQKESESNKTLTFHKDKAISFSQADIFKDKQSILLDARDSALIPAYPSLLVDRDFFVYSRSAGSAVLRFDSLGVFKNKIGAIGGGPGEYTELSDISLNTASKQVEIFTNATICRYAYGGHYINNITCDYPASSFIKGDTDGYWIYTGNNKNFSPYKLFKCNDSITTHTGYLKSEWEMFSLMENNFGYGEAICTFHEGFNNQLYKINNDSVIPTYYLSFPRLELPASLYTTPPMEVLPFLKTFDWASVKSYFENDNFVYLLIMVNHKNGIEPDFYHWIVNKENKEGTIIKQNNVSPDSYLLSPKYLTLDNRLFFIGYPIENENDLANPDTNPSILVVYLK